jgi:GWxTD domain-containing protein
MKKFLFLLSVSVMLLVPSLQAKNLQAKFAYCSYFAPEKGPYMETYMEVAGKSVVYKALPSGLFQAAIEVTQLFRQGDSIRYYNKYNLLSPESKDTITSLFNFTDQQRMSLANGTYTMELIIRDKNNPDAKPYNLTESVTMAYYPNIIGISDVELLSSFKPSVETNKITKNGYELIPLVDNFFGPSVNSLKFYAEVYNTSSIILNDAFLLSYHIETLEKKRVIDAYTRTSRQAAKPVNILLADLDITDLPSGNYNFVIEVRNRLNELLAVKESFFQRSKGAAPVSESGVVSYNNIDVRNTFVADYTSKDTLAEYIRCLYPICSTNENTFATNQLEIADLKLMQQFFYDFWSRRNPLNPSEAWLAYSSEVDKVNAEYSAGKKKGYMTERGRVYLAYGAPNQISKQYAEPTSYPYEIWQYYKVKDETNRKFVFWSQQIATNDFELLHSDAKGEIFNANWQVELRRRTEKMNDLDKTSPNNNFQNQSNQLFQNPR